MIQEEHDRFMQWSKLLSLPVNEAKSKCMTIKKVESCPIPVITGVESVNTMRILGITFNSKWNADTHVAKMVSTASRRLYALRILKSSLAKKEMILVFNSISRSLLEYCAPLFLGLSAKNENKMERIQLRFHRMICGKSCSQACIQPLKERRRMLSLKFLNKIIKLGHVLHPLLPPMSPAGRFLLTPRRTTKRCMSYFPMVCELYNQNFSR